MCDQQRLRPACTYAQSGQSLCYSLEYSMTVNLLTEHHLEFLSLKEGCTGVSESTLVKMPHCWKSCVMAQMQILPGKAITREKVRCRHRLRHLIRKRKQFPPKDSSKESRSTQQSITVIDLQYCHFIATICLGLLQYFSTLKAQCRSHK